MCVCALLAGAAAAMGKTQLADCLHGSLADIAHINKEGITLIQEL